MAPNIQIMTIDATRSTVYLGAQPVGVWDRSFGYVGRKITESDWHLFNTLTDMVDYLCSN